MGNPFDQFDEPGSTPAPNPFDQFDDNPNGKVPEETSFLGTIGKGIANAPATIARAAGGALRSIGESGPLSIKDVNPALGGENDPQQPDLTEARAAAAKSAEVPGTPANVGKRIFASASDYLRTHAPNVPAGSLKDYAYQITQGVTEMVPLIAATAVTKSPVVGAALIAGQSYGEKYGQAREDGRNIDQASMDAGFSALVNGSMASLPLSVVMRPGASFLGKTLTTAGAVAFQNVATEAMQMGYDKGVIGSDMTLGEAVNRLKQAGIVGAVTGAFLGAGEHGIERLAGRPAAAPPAEGGLPPGPEAPPPGTPPAIAREPINPIDIHPGDAESPIPTEIIAAGRKRIREATSGTATAGDVALEQQLAAHRMPEPRAAETQETLGNSPQTAENTAIAARPPGPDFEPLFDDENQTTQIGWYNGKTGEVQRIDAAAPPAPEEITPAPAPEPTGDGTRAAPTEVTHPDHLETASEQVNTNPTDGQKGAGNYAKAHVKVQGLDIAIENPKGSERSGVGPDGTPWAVKMPAAYGYVKRSTGADGEQVDVYVGQNPQSTKVFVIDQKDAETGKFDEHKAMLGFDSREQAVQAYSAAFSDGKAAQRFGGVREMNTLQFKKLLKSDVLDKPVANLNTTGRVRGLRRAPPSGPVDVASFLAAKGGIRNDEGHDLVKGRGLQQLVPGKGPLIRSTGMSMDYAGESLHEAGYFGPPESTPRPTENEVLQLLERTGRGPDGRPTKVFAAEDQAEAGAKRETARIEEENAAALADVHSHAKEMGETLTDEEAGQILSNMHTHGIDPESALAEHIERKAIREDNEDNDRAQSTAKAEPVEIRQAETDRPAGPVVERPEPAGRDESAPGQARRPTTENPGEGALTTERGAEGFDQTIVPGGEQSARQLAAAREAQGRGRASTKVQQKPAEGMFAELKAEEPDMFAPKPKGDEPLFAGRDGEAAGGSQVRVRYSPEFDAQREQVGADLRKRLDDLGLHDIALKVPDVILAVEDGKASPQDGVYLDKLMAVALDTKDKTGTLDHEAIHALRSLDLFNGSEWSILDGRAAREWRAKYNIDKRYGDLSEEKLNEEAVAEAFRYWRKDQSAQTGIVARLFHKMRNALDAIWSALRGRGFTTADSIFGKAASGEVGAREGTGAPGDGPSFARREERGGIFDRMAVDPARSVVDHLTDSSLGMVDRLKAGISREAIGESIDRWRTAFQDRYLPMLRVQAAVEQQLGRHLAENENPYLKEELSTGRKGAKLEELSERHVHPLFLDMQEKGVTVAELESYLYARHAPERNARIEKINPKFRGDMLDEAKAGSGMSNDEAAAIIAAADRAGKKAALDALAKRVDDILAYGVKERVEAGLLSKDDAAAWKNTYEHYVPLRGHAELDPEMAAERPRIGRPTSVRGKESQMAFGRVSKASDILAYSIMQAEEAIVRGENNRIANAFHDLAKTSPNPDFWKIDKIQNRPVFNKQSQQVEYRPTDRIAAEDAPYTVSTKINGIEHRVTLNRHNPMAVRLAQGMRSMGSDQTGLLVHTFGAVNRFLSHVNTTLNPEFVITNAFRDIQEASINLNQHDIPGIVKNTLRDYPKALKGSLQGAFKKGDGTWRKYYDEFREAGGRVYFNRTDDIPGLRTRIVNEVRDAKPGLTARKAIKSIYTLVEGVNTGVENAVRLSAYKNAREGGMTVAQAASLAKNLTINFNRRGTYGPLMNSLYLFYNASVQGSAVMLTALKSPAVRRIAYGAIAAGAGLEMMNALSSDKDKDGELFYDKIDAYDKAHNLIIMDPTSDAGRYFKIPLPYGYGTFFAMGRAASEMYRGKQFSDIIGNLGSTLMDSFNPVGGAGSLLNLIAPTVIDPIVDLEQNKDYAGRPIMPNQPAFGPKIPESQRYWGSVSPYFKGITDTLNSVTGGDDVVPGKIDVSPEVLQYLFGTATGAAGTFFERNADFVAKLTDPTSQMSWGDVPMARKLVGNKSPAVDRSAVYQRTQDIQQIEAQIKDYRRTGRPDQARALRQENSDLLSLAGRANSTRDQLAMARHQIAKAQRDFEDGKITKEAFQARKLSVQAREQAIIDRFNTAYISRTGSVN